MLKASVALVAICASTVAAAYWIESHTHPTKTPVQVLTMPSLDELHNRARAESLPVQEVKEPF